ncbi:triose-phosphate isomerase family protein [Nocardia sp. NPDC050435]
MTCTNTKAAMSAADHRVWLESVVLPLSDELANAGFFACVPDPLISATRALLRDSAIGVGAQDAWYEAGDYTGESPASLLAELGCTHVMLGHADRRARGESDELTARKVVGALAGGLMPLVCVGEVDRVSTDEAGAYVVAQLAPVLDAVDPGTEFAVMYEPGWSIGARAAAPEHVAGVCETVRGHLAARSRSSVSLLYGGGVEPGTYSALVAAGADIAGLGLGHVVKEKSLLAEVLAELHEAARFAGRD